MKRTLVLVTVALVMAAVLVVMVVPAVAARPTPTKQECREIMMAHLHGEKLTGQQKQVVRQYATFSDCVQASN